MAVPTLALKVDVDTLRGTREGVPRLVELLQRLHAQATFLFSVGPDHTGRALRRVFRRGFLSKVRRTSVVSNYGLGTLLYGTLLPGPRIGERCVSQMRAVLAAGFEVGLHAHDHVKWQDGVSQASAAWTRRELELACREYRQIFACRPLIHGAAGWQVNAHVPLLEAELGFEFASDTRGHGPFRPAGGGVPQLPTTLPTLDELIGRNDLTSDDPVETLLAMTQNPPPQGHVFTLHAEIEGGAYALPFERLLQGWRAQGYHFVTMGEMFRALDGAALPCNAIVRGAVPGRSGTLALQAME
ncbi:MAG TPA: polysaccharide deacetylase family protein [Steroidobacteraceae bacterium]|nr:polysaccharide deacetylase family protein [Steroidobacteraceae bacterium]HRX89348.1 polysaccharide deacetylase family protein [Steroidobacteraceae bacterium]